MTHIRTPDRRCLPLCGAAPSESISLMHWQMAYTTQADLVEAYDSEKRRVLIDRKASILDGVEKLPHPLCADCAALAQAQPPVAWPSLGDRAR